MVAEEIIKLREEIPEGISLVAVSKFHPASMIREAYDVGHRLFGESRVQELLEKIPLLPEDIEWHFIGHLQTNKVRQLIGKVALIESVDSEKLLALIDSESRKAGVVTNVLMQVHVAAEETKFGFLPEELMSYFKDKRFENLTNTHICGVMGMASNTSDMSRVRADFAEIRRIFREISEDSSLGLRGFDRVSMGMSHDWRIAVEEGSTSVRIGSLIFGEREY
mgnify:FL=1